MPKKLTRVDIPVVNEVADQLANIGHDLGQMFEKAQFVLDENWGCWGHDHAGQQLGDNLAPNIKTLMVGDNEALGGTELCGHISGLGAHLRLVTEAFAQLDTAAGESLTFDE